jgi:hypothetical protein
MTSAAAGEAINSNVLKNKARMNTPVIARRAAPRQSSWIASLRSQ